MATAAYRRWVKAGRKFELARPISELVQWAKANGVPILGTIGNEAHLQQDRPEDHTPFSGTAWPVTATGYICAIDLRNVRQLGQRIEDMARRGELPWLKYMNHSRQHLDSRDFDGDGKSWEESPSSDEHVHLSIRTDWIHRSIGVFDPFDSWEEPLKLDKDDQEFLRTLRFGELPTRGDIDPAGATGLGVDWHTYRWAGEAAKDAKSAIVAAAGAHRQALVATQRVDRLGEQLGATRLDLLTAIEQHPAGPAIDYDKLAEALIRRVVAGFGP